MAHVAQWKLDVTSKLSEKINDYKVLGIVDIAGIPAPIIQKMRSDIRTYGNLVVMKKTLIYHILEKLEKENEALERMKGMVKDSVVPGIILTDMDSFKLFRKFKEGKKNAPARGGEIAPEDIVVVKGDTPFKPGPIISEFGKVGIPAAIEKGKVVIKKTTTLVKKGEKIPRDVAQMITKLEIFPIVLGINLNGTYEDGVLFTKDVLDVDLEMFKSSLSGAVAEAFNLSMNIGYVTDLTISPLISKAYTDAISLSLAIGFVTRDNAEMIVQEAYSEAMTLAGMLSPEAVDGDIREVLGRITAPKAPETTEKKVESKEEEEEQEEEEEVSEEEAAAGLGALFG